MCTLKQVIFKDPYVSGCIYPFLSSLQCLSQLAELNQTAGCISLAEGKILQEQAGTPTPKHLC